MPITGQAYNHRGLIKFRGLKDTKTLRPLNFFVILLDLCIHHFHSHDSYL